jgi:hypothetical protein
VLTETCVCRTRKNNKEVKMLENKMLWTVLRHKRTAETEGWKKCTNSTLKRFSIKMGGGRDIADYVDNPQTTLEGDTAGSSPHGAI